MGNNVKFTNKGGLYDKAYKDGFEKGRHFMFEEIIDMTLKCVMISLYQDDFPSEDIMTVKEQVTDAIFFYGTHPKEMNEYIKGIEEETGMDLKFHSDGRKEYYANLKLESEER